MPLKIGRFVKRKRDSRNYVKKVHTYYKFYFSVLTQVCGKKEYPKWTAGPKGSETVVCVLFITNSKATCVPAKLDHRLVQVRFEVTLIYSGWNISLKLIQRFQNHRSPVKCLNPTEPGWTFILFLAASLALLPRHWSIELVSSLNTTVRASRLNSVQT